MITETIDIASLSPDPGNVRRHSERNIEAVIASLKRFGQQLPLVVDGGNVVRVGNCRLEAMKRLGWSHATIVRTSLSGADLVAYSIADNRSGDPEVGSTFDAESLAATLQALSLEDGDLLASTGFTATELDRMVAELSGTAVDNNPDAEWVGMPTCESEDQTARASVKINFASLDDRDAFAKLIGQTITDNTRSLWYPPAEIGRIADKRYAEVPQ